MSSSAGRDERPSRATDGATDGKARGAVAVIATVTALATLTLVAAAEVTAQPRRGPDPNVRGFGAVAPVPVDVRALEESEIAPAAEVKDAPEPEAIVVPPPARPDETGDEAEAEVPPELAEAAAARSGQLVGCRSEAGARPRGTRAATPRVLARFTVQPDGAVTDAEVIALRPMSTEVMYCVRDRISGWRFDPAPGREAVRVSREFTLR